MYIVLCPWSRFSISRLPPSDTGLKLTGHSSRLIALTGSGGAGLQILCKCNQILANVSIVVQTELKQESSVEVFKALIFSSSGTVFPVQFSRS
eukprot:4592545-Ditylum_brightwellii.AAC.1